MTNTRKKVTPRDVFEYLSQGIQALSKNISAILIIGGAVVGLCTWGINQVMAKVDQRVDEVKTVLTEIENTNNKTNHEQELALKRLELMALIDYDPTNKTQIERVARYYFVVLDGDQYMSGVYSDWAAKYDGNTSFVKE